MRFPSLGLPVPIQRDLFFNINYVGSLAEILWSDPNILSIENPVESEILLVTKESSTWLVDSSASYHVTPHRMWQFLARISDSVELEIRNTTPSSEDGIHAGFS